MGPVRAGLDTLWNAGERIWPLFGVARKPWRPSAATPRPAISPLELIQFANRRYSPAGFATTSLLRSVTPLLSHRTAVNVEKPGPMEAPTTSPASLIPFARLMGTPAK